MRDSGDGSGARWYQAVERRFPDVEMLFAPVRAERAIHALWALGHHLPADVARRIVRLALWPQKSQNP